MHLSPALVTFLCVIAWPALTGIVNALFHLCTPKDVDAWAERNPFVARVAAFARRLGFEPVAMITLVAGWFASNPPPPSVVSGNVAMGKKRGFIDGDALRAMVGVVLLAGLALGMAACAGFWTPARKGAAEDVAACMLAGSLELEVSGSLTPEQEAMLAVKCGTTPKDVHDFILGHPDAIATARAGVRKAEAAKGCPK